MVDNVTHLAPLGYNDHESLRWSYMVDNVTHLVPLGYNDHESLRWSYMVDNVTHLAPLGYRDHESLRWSYMVDNVTHLAPLGYRDHESLRWSYICYAGAPANKRLSGSRNCPKGEYDVIKESLSKTDWESKFHGNSVNTNWTELKAEISKAVRENVPPVKCKMNNKPPWWSKQMPRTVKRKYNLYKGYNSSELDREYNYCLCQTEKRDKR